MFFIKSLRKKILLLELAALSKFSSHPSKLQYRKHTTNTAPALQLLKRSLKSPFFLCACRKVLMERRYSCRIRNKTWWARRFRRRPAAAFGAPRALVLIFHGARGGAGRGAPRGPAGDERLGECATGKAREARGAARPTHRTFAYRVQRPRIASHRITAPSIKTRFDREGSWDGCTCALSWPEVGDLRETLH